MDSELLLGHKKQNYYKPTLEHLVEEYRKALPLLAISEIVELEKQLTEKEQDFTKERTSWMGQLAEIHSLIRERDKLTKDHVAGLEADVRELRKKVGEKVDGE